MVQQTTQKTLVKKQQTNKYPQIQTPPKKKTTTLKTNQKQQELKTTELPNYLPFFFPL